MKTTLSPGSTLTTDSSQSSYGRPVLVLNGHTLGPDDLLPHRNAPARVYVAEWLGRSNDPDFDDHVRGNRPDGTLAEAQAMARKFVS